MLIKYRKARTASLCMSRQKKKLEFKIFLKKQNQDAVDVLFCVLQDELCSLGCVLSCYTVIPFRFGVL
nr:hypothetical protein CFP56_18176 [Quercus suber]